MSEAITIQVSEQVLHRAKHKAVQNQRQVEEVLSDWLERAVTETPIDELPDDEVLTLTELQLSPIQEEALSNLLARNRENTLDIEGRRQLDELMRVYEHGLLRKAQALRVAVQRGLREPLQP
jgi:hypothetical protein